MRCSIFLCLALAAAAGAADRPVDYARDIKHLLQERCFACHGALKQQGKLRLDSGALIHKGGKSGPIVVPGSAGESLLIRKVTDQEEGVRMPPEGQPLTADQVAALRAWINQGAKYPADDPPEPDPRDHWAFRAPVRLPVPSVEPAWGRNAIDAFLAAEWRKRRLKPQPFADRRLLLRRLYLDLTGLPPTSDQIDAFLNDPSPNAYEKVADRLLDSPQYGERWGRHFMDVWRYSDWWGLGAEVRNSQKHMWHWRDWIIESLNADKGYDRMAREMLAADELYPTDLGALRATGYLARQYFIFNRTTWMDETVEHTAKSFLGLTLNCTKCHDHKYDPIRQDDYYRFRAFFEPYQVRAEMVPGESDFEKDAIPCGFDCNLDTPTYKHRRGDDRQPVKDVKITPGLPAVLAGELKIEPVTLPPEAFAPHLRPFVEANYLRAAEAKMVVARDAVAKARAALAAAERDAKREAAPVATSDSQPVGNIIGKDDFGRANPDLWEIGPGRWNHQKGALVQSLPGEDRSRIRFKPTVPADFDARLKYMVTGGEPWRSVGVSFDVAGDNETLVYTSANDGGPKLQIAYKQGGNYVYPADGMVARPFKVGDTIELTVRVRGQLVNVAVNGEHALAYRLPVPRKPGAVELITFAATAEFRAFELKALPADAKLHEAAGGAKSVPTKPNPEQARLALVVAEKALAAAEAEIPSLKARFAAERANFDKAPDAGGLAKAAAKAEKQAALAAAGEALAKAELEVAQAATAHKPAAEKRRDAARAAVASATKAVENPGNTYTVPRGALKTKENNLETDASRLKPFPTNSTGRRSALANWITDCQNPLAARVAVNHVWNRHFGTPLVATVFDFGRKGAKPTHPELLDWLAVEFMESGWSLKHLHKLIVMSDFYRLSSSTAGADPATTKADSENRYLWRRDPVRMESEVVRDSLLCLAGQLDPTPGGPSVDVNADSKRRSLYFVHSHNDHHKFLMQFDDAGVLECYRRTESIVPQQALTLANSKFTLTMADAIAARLSVRVSGGSDSDFVTAAFELVLASTPTTEERQACLGALAEWRKVLTEQKHPDPSGKARADLVGALVNHNDFVTVR